MIRFRITMIFLLLAPMWGYGQTDSHKNVFDFMTYELVGMHDKPIKVLVTSVLLESDSLWNYTSVIKVDSTVFIHVAHYTETNDTRVTKVRGANFASFRVTLQTARSRISFMLVSKEESKMFFEGMLRLLKDGEVPRPQRLIRELEYTLNRLAF